jgi:hypothetical protein
MTHAMPREIQRQTVSTKQTGSHLDGESTGTDERFANGLLYPHEPGRAGIRNRELSVLNRLSH